MPKRVIAVTIATLLCSTACADDGPAPPKPAAPAAAAPASTTAAAPPPAAAAAAPAEMPSQASPPPAAEARLAQRIRIDEIAFFQGTKTSVAKGGARVGDDKRALPVIAERDALVRVYVTPEQGAIGHDVTAEIYLETDGIIRVARQSATIAGPSREDDPGSTFDFHLPGENIGPTTRYLVRLIDDAAPPIAASAKSAGQYPDTGTFEDLGAKHASKLRLVIVPVRYTGDGSGRLPDLSPPVLDSIRKRMLEFYPVPDVELTVRQTVSWNAPVLATGAGWDALLGALTQLRLTDGVPLDVYYYGAIAPKATYDAYCPGDCLLGLSNLSAGLADPTGRASVGAQYPNPTAIDTVPHEIGHAHGQHHAPCGGATETDPSYPYADARSGKWGYSVVTKTLMPPTLYDQMSYCVPAWQSDYVYRTFFRRARELAGLRIAPPSSPPKTYRMLRVSADGELAWGGDPFTSSEPIGGALHRVRFVDDRDGTVAEVTAHGYGFDHVPGGQLVVPYESIPRHARLRIDLREHGETSPIRALRRHLGSALDVQ